MTRFQSATAVSHSPDFSSYVRWFRDSSPYIHAHRGRTFVVSLGGESIEDGTFARLAQDFSLLNSLGIRLVIVHGVRPQVEQRLKLRGAALRYVNGLRVTDPVALECVKEAAGTVRVEIEALLSMGLANSPMANASIRVSSGNFVIAKPLGVRDGVDFCHTGEVRRIDSESIRTKLEQGDVVLLSPIGYSATGEVFNLSAEEIATAVAISLRADKLLLLTEGTDLVNSAGSPYRQLVTLEAERLLALPELNDSPARPHLKAAVAACNQGVSRAHLIDRKVDGAILLELFTRDGIGTLVSSTPFETLRAASIYDVGGILDLIRPLEEKGVLVKRSRENLEMEIEHFSVIERDGLIVGCAALHGFPEDRMGELACLAMHGEYRGERRGARLLEHVEQQARSIGLDKLFVLTTQTTHWFREQGFDHADIADLPMRRQAIYNYQRNSKVLVKPLDLTKPV